MAGALNLSLSLSLKKPLLISLSSFPANSKLRRRNHLREKLLKTLTKPYPNSIVPIEPPPSSLIPIKPPIDRIMPIEPENLQQSEVKNVENDGVISVIKGEFGKYWVLKLGLYLVGIFVFQMICTVLVFGSDDIVEKEGKDLVFEGKLKKRSNILVNENGYLGVSDVDERVGEIRALAREVRESERLKSKADEEDNGGVFRTGIEREVDRRLVKLQKKLQSSAKKMPGVAVREKGDLEGRGTFERLMIKKKYKFRGHSGGSSNKSKGFGTKDSKVNESDNSELASKDERSIFDSVTQPLRNDTEQSKESSKRVQTLENKLGKEGMQVKSAKAEPSSRMGATQEGSLRRLVGGNKSTRKVEDKQLKAKASHWWLSLPYVVAVLMGRGHDGEGPRGLFTLKTDPSAKDEECNLSCLVAFEDRGDATNFCYILESFFEDLGDFSADIVPLSTKELEEEVKSQSKKVVVVKKGQLKLYAGQPLVDVEMALRSLVE